MRILTLTFLLLLTSFYSHAQDNRVSLRINEFAWYKIKASTNDTLMSSNDRLKQILPTVGFYHTFKNNVGIGVEIGYQKSNLKQSSMADLPIYTTIYRSEYSSPTTAYYICPSIYETFRFKRYLLNLSLILPVKYISNKEDNGGAKLYDRQTGIVVEEEFNYTKWPAIFQYGLHVQPSIYRCIYKGLYAGAEFALGIDAETRMGTVTKEYRWYKNNALILQSKEEIKYEAYTVFSLGTRISFSLQYHFNKRK